LFQFATLMARADAGVDAVGGNPDETKYPYVEIPSLLTKCQILTKLGWTKQHFVKRRDWLTDCHRTPTDFDPPNIYDHPKIDPTIPCRPFNLCRSGMRAMLAPVELWTLLIFCGCCRNIQHGIAVYRAHLAGFPPPIFGRILHGAERMDPQVPEIQRRQTSIASGNVCERSSRGNLSFKVSTFDVRSFNGM
jgi:hypothetical protein